ncbi:hypothetical protein D3P07_15535 [Paenibacillus sp. 1011MAR3C5]|uniref:hypothetical protein n=1 Tax=Paenibacillus sp. 1011MAR3C5 TaxID=1675787 RepID=UPI000E6D2EB2|nr:hypothetical protein [Paenibacillus sp. 1011MAR3C5]RJE87716.1 hypothetical protein D3P07_15535 [Paenibacillus sp. 1011MAR3C5]
MYSTEILKKFTILNAVFSIVVIIFSCYGVIILIDRRHQHTADFEMALYFFLFLIFTASLLSIFLTYSIHRIREALEFEISSLRNELAQHEKRVDQLLKP